MFQFATETLFELLVILDTPPRNNDRKEGLSIGDNHVLNSVSPEHVSIPAMERIDCIHRKRIQASQFEFLGQLSCAVKNHVVGFLPFNVYLMGGQDGHDAAILPRPSGGSRGLLGS